MLIYSVGNSISRLNKILRIFENKRFLGAENEGMHKYSNASFESLGNVEWPIFFHHMIGSVFLLIIFTFAYLQKQTRIINVLKCY